MLRVRHPKRAHELSTWNVKLYSSVYVILAARLLLARIR